MFNTTNNSRCCHTDSNTRLPHLPERHRAAAAAPHVVHLGFVAADLGDRVAQITVVRDCVETEIEMRVKNQHVPFPNQPRGRCNHSMDAILEKCAAAMGGTARKKKGQPGGAGGAVHALADEVQALARDVGHHVVEVLLVELSATAGAVA